MEQLLFHHARDIEYVRYGVVRQALHSDSCQEHECSSGCDDALFEAAYRWAAERLGFWPVFLAVGGDDEDRRMTGYQDQWMRSTTPDDKKRPQSRVLFSWGEPPPDAVFMDFDAWHIVLGSVEVSGEDGNRLFVRPLSNWVERQIWKRSWPPSAWLRAARGTTSVQAVVRELDLRTADALWCRNEGDRKRLLSLGFDADKIKVRRLRVDR